MIQPIRTMRTIRSMRNLAQRSLRDRYFYVLSLMFLCAFTVLLAMLWHEHGALKKEAVLHSAKRKSEILREVRTLYTSEVVAQVSSSGIEVTHDYINRESAIPLPETFSMLLGERMGKGGKTARARLYSPFPFPWRKEAGGLTDEFEKDAWAALNLNPSEPYFAFTHYEGKESLRYATADLMREACINCHNSHPESPKTDWRVGDVRGVLEVILPLNAEAQPAVSTARVTIIGLIAILGLIGVLLAFHIGRLRRDQDVRSAQATALKQREEDLSITLDSLGVAVISTDLGSRVTRMNAVAEKLTGWTRDQGYGTLVDEVFTVRPSKTLASATELATLASNAQSPASENPIIDAVLRTATTVELFRESILCSKPGGQELRVDCSGAPIRKADGSINGVVLVFRDVTATARLEERLRQSEKMEAIGQLAGGLSHDFNNLLCGLVGCLELIEDERTSQKDRAEYLEIMKKTCDRATELTSKLVSFSRGGTLSSLDFDIHLLIGEVIGLTRSTFDRRIEISENFLAQSAMVHGDPSQVQNVLLNLLLNAKDAMPEGGQLCISTNTVTVDEEIGAEFYDPVTPGQFLEVTVSDTGCGMSSDILQRIFEPFFTTKKTGKGTGLGLSSAHGAILNHKGTITVTSSPERGSVFKVYFPLVRPNQAVEAGKREVLGVQGASVLIVDDEHIVRRSTEKILELLGYSVTTAEDGEQGVVEFQRMHDDLDLVLLDMVMPKLNGLEAFREMQAIDPSVPVVLVSGFSLESDLEELKALGITGILKKPYNTDDLAAMIERTIAKRSRSEWSQGLTNSALSALVQDGSHVFATPVDPTDIQARPVE